MPLATTLLYSNVVFEHGNNCFASKMKIIILHGEDTEKSYTRLKKFVDVARDRSWEVSYINDSNQSFQECLSASSLFGNERFFILKDIKKLGKKDLEWLKDNYLGLGGNLIIYSDKSLNVSTLKSFPKETKIEEFKLPVLLWNFLDGLYPGNDTREVQVLHKIIEKQPIEFVFSLIAKHFKELYWVKTGAASAGFPFWKINKLKSQASKFSEEKLKEIIGLLAEIDIKVKTSKTDLISELDLMLIKHLE